MEYTYSTVGRDSKRWRGRGRCEEAIQRLKPFGLAQESGPVSQHETNCGPLWLCELSCLQWMASWTSVLRNQWKYCTWLLNSNIITYEIEIIRMVWWQGCLEIWIGDYLIVHEKYWKSGSVFWQRTFELMHIWKGSFDFMLAIADFSVSFSDKQQFSISIPVLTFVLTHWVRHVVSNWVRHVVSNKPMMILWWTRHPSVTRLQTCTNLSFQALDAFSYFLTNKL